MKLLTTERTDDFGPELRIGLLVGRRFTLLRLALGLSDYGGDLPYLQMSLGNNSVFSLFFYVWRLYIDLDFACRTWHPLDIDQHPLL
jgi:hypothetical protein